MRLTKSSLDVLTCDSGRKDRIYFDDDLPGFGIRVTDKGGKTWLVQYRSGGKLRRMKIGSARVLAPDKARAKAKVLLGCVAGGGDPYVEAQASVATAEKAEREAAEAERANSFSLRKLIDEFEAKYAARKRYGSEAIRALKVNLADWLDRPAHSFKPAEFVKHLDAIAEDRGPISANRTLAYARKMYNWAVARQLVPANPLTGIPRPADERSRDRALSNDELAAVWKASDALGEPFRAFVRLLILTMQRRDEVAGMRWSELSPDRTLWTIPAERAKNGKAHIVHLSPQAQTTLATVQPFKP
ncbi:MAG: tyrosine-type recombinase/integrase, partial [Stellaceae bacterium]